MVALLVDRTPEAERGLAIGTLSGSWDVGVVIGSLIIGVTVERVSYAAGFLVAGGASIAGLATFVVTERRRVRRLCATPRRGYHSSRSSLTARGGSSQSKRNPT